LPVSLMYTVPWGFLSAVLLVFGRLSSAQEITAFRVAGISLVRLAVPVFVVGAVLSLASLWLNINVVPRSKATVAQLIYEQASRDPESLLRPGVVQGNFRGDASEIQKVLIEGRRDGWVEGFHFYQTPGGGREGDRTYVHAARAALAVDEAKSQLRVKLENAWFETRREDGRVEMAFAGKAEPLLIDLKNPRSRRSKPNAMTNDEIRARLATVPPPDSRQEVRLQMELTKRYSFSMACLAFAFIGVPLGLGARRRDSSTGLLTSLAIGTAYFLITMLAEHSASSAVATAVLWAPNVGCVLLGILLFRRARFK
jgi:lipopolysaccharide export system permease protein